KRWEAAKSCTLRPIELTQLGHLRQEQGRCARPDAGNGSKFLRCNAELLVLCDQTGDTCIDRSDLLFDFVKQARLKTRTSAQPNCSSLLCSASKSPLRCRRWASYSRRRLCSAQCGRVGDRCLAAPKAESTRPSVLSVFVRFPAA